MGDHICREIWKGVWNISSLFSVVSWLRPESPRDVTCHIYHSYYILSVASKPVCFKKSKLSLKMWKKHIQNKRWCQFLASHQSCEERAKLQIVLEVRRVNSPFLLPIPAPTQPPVRLHLSMNGVPLSTMLSRRSDRCLLICLNEKNQSEEPAQLLLSSGFAHERWVWLTDASRFTVYWFLQKSQICQFRQGSDTKLSI